MNNFRRLALVSLGLLTGCSHAIDPIPSNEGARPSYGFGKGIPDSIHSAAGVDSKTRQATSDVQSVQTEETTSTFDSLSATDSTPVEEPAPSTPTTSTESTSPPAPSRLSGLSSTRNLQLASSATVKNPIKYHVWVEGKILADFLAQVQSNMVLRIRAVLLESAITDWEGPYTLATAQEIVRIIQSICHTCAPIDIVRSGTLGGSRGN